MFLAATLLLVSLTNCARKNAAIERVAILPANVLVSDAKSQWLKIAVPLILQQDLMTSRGLIPGVTMDESTANQAKATQALRTTVESRQNGLHIEGKLFDLKTQKVLQVKSVDAPAIGGLITAVNALAKMFDPGASNYSTSNLEALESYLAAASTNNRQQRVQQLQQAAAKDSGFALAYIALIEMIAPNVQADPSQFLNEAKSHRAQFSAYDRAKFDLAIGRVVGASASDQIKQAQEALKYAPNDLDALASLGMNQFLDGDAKAGEESLRHAVSLNPANPALQLQLGRGLLQAGKLKEADSVLSAIEKNPAALPDLATCVLLEGDTARANTIADKLFAAVQSAEVRPLLAASWQYMAGQQQKAIDLLLNGKFTNPNVQAVAFTEAALWQVMVRDYKGAKSTLQRANSTTGQAASFPAVAAFLLDREGTSADWQKRVQAAALPANVKEPLLAYGFFLRGNYDEASVQWKTVLDRSHGADLRARAMLASCLDHAGKKSEAQKIKVVPFVPEFGDLYAVIPFGEMRRILGYEKR